MPTVSRLNIHKYVVPSVIVHWAVCTIVFWVQSHTPTGEATAVFQSLMAVRKCMRMSSARTNSGIGPLATGYRVSTLPNFDE